MLCLWIMATAGCQVFAWAPLSPIGNRKANDSSLHLDPSAINEFVRGLDSALGNTAGPAGTLPPESYSNVVETSFPNSNILLGGGVAALSLGGLAFGLSLQDEDNTSEREQAEPTTIEQISVRRKDEGSSLRQKEVDTWSDATEASTATSIASNNEVQILDSTVTVKQTEVISSEGKAKLNEGEALEVEAELDKEKAKRKEVEQKSLWIQTVANKLSAKLRLKTEELDANQRLLEDERSIRSKVELKLQAEKNLREETEDGLAAAAESNRQLEDKYELEQNAKEVKIRELAVTKESLDTTQKQLTKTQKVLSQVKTDLQTTRKTLETTSSSLDKLKEEERSLRTLGKKMWRLSKSRTQNRIRSVGSRLRKDK